MLAQWPLTVVWCILWGGRGRLGSFGLCRVPIHSPKLASLRYQDVVAWRTRCIGQIDPQNTCFIHRISYIVCLHFLEGWWIGWLIEAGLAYLVALNRPTVWPVRGWWQSSAVGLYVF